MITAKNKKEVNLDAQTISLLQIQADKEGRELKDYMETVLTEKANEFELTDEYKAMMDKLLDKHQQGKLDYISEDDFRKLTARKWNIICILRQVL